MPSRNATLALAFSLALTTAAFTTPTAAQTFTTVDHPSGAITVLYDISGNTAVGLWNDVIRTGPFRYDITTGAVSPIDNPNASDSRDTHVHAIAGNRLAGYQTNFGGLDNDYRGLLFDGTTWNLFSVHTNPDGRTIAYGLDDDTDTVVGSYTLANSTRGFLRSPDGTITTLQYPGSLHTEAFDIDGSRIIGSYQLPEGRMGGFLFDGLNWLPLNFPGVTQDTTPLGIDGDLIVGEYREVLPAGGRRGFIYDLSSDTWTPFDIPDAESTTVSGIDGDTIVGSYMTTNGEIHGFVATIPEPSLTVVVPLTFAALRRRRQPH